MTFRENKYSPEFLFGNVEVDRNALASLRASKRRSDPNGGSNVPFYSGASGKFLRVTYTTEPALSETTLDIGLSSDSLAQIITDINNAAPSNINAIDVGGYLVIRNSNPGKRHLIRISPYSVPASDAAPVLGFVVNPYPGSVGYVNEVTTTPGTRSQGNPPGTSLVANAEDLRPGALNRIFASILNLIQENIQDLERPVIVYKYKYFATTAHQVSTNEYYVKINDNSMLLPIYLPTDTQVGIGDVPAKYWVKAYTGQFTSVPDGQAFVTAFDDTATAVGDWSAPTRNEHTVVDIVYGTGSEDISIYPDAGQPFQVWGTPDGKSIYGIGDVDNLNKQATVNITSIVGNIIECATAQFVTKLVRKGDPVYLVASVLTPFDHSGWFAVKEVYDETHIAVRPMAAGERIPTNPLTNNIKPRTLNPAANGTLTVKVGFHIPAGNALVVIRPKSALSNVVLRIPCVVPLREALVENLNVIAESAVDMGLYTVNQHMMRVNKDAHPAKAIKGYASTTFADGSSISGLTMRLDEWLDQLITLLKSNTASPGGGSKRIGAEAVSLVGGSPTAYSGLNRSLASGTVDSQHLELLTKLRDHEVDETRHDARGVLSGLGVTASAGLNITIASGNCLVFGKYLSVSGAVVALTNNATNWVYVNSTTGVLTATTSASTACADSDLALYKVTTSGGAITATSDVRRNYVQLRKKGFWTVGTTGCDFASLKGALDFLAEYRLSTGQQTVEIVIQGVADVSTTINLTFPVTIRGAALDNSALVGGPLARLRGTLAGQPMFRCAVSTLHNVVFKDLYVTIEGTDSASCFLRNDDAGTAGNDWVFNNCIFENAPNNGWVFNLSPADSTKDWLWNNCVFQNRVGTGTFVYVGDNCTGYTFDNCKFRGTTADATVSGVSMSEGAVEPIFTNCLFEMGGIHLYIQTTTDMVRASGCRFKSSRADSIYFISSGELYLTDCTFSGCMAASSTARGVIMSDSGAGVIIANDCRFKNWATGYAVRAIGNTGVGSRFVNNFFSASAPDRAISGFSHALFMGNDIDLSPGAASGSGRDIAVVLSVSSNNRITSNAFRNCGSTATASADTVISANANNVINNNNFSNCRGILIDTTGAHNAISNNVGTDVGASANDIGVKVAGANCTVHGNVLGQITSGKAVFVSTTGLHAHVIGNAVETALPATGLAGLTGGVQRKKEFFDGDSQNVTGSTTKSLAFVTMSSDIYGSHLPEMVNLPPKVSTLEAGLRVTYGDGTTDVIFNTTAGDKVVRFDDENADLDFVGVATMYMDIDSDKTLVAIEFVVRNVGATTTQTMGQWRYYGWIVG